VADITRVREEEALLTRRQWEISLQRPVMAGIRTRDAILPHLAEWLDRAYGGATFHLTQILTGHGCFGSYLHRIQRIDTPICLLCGSGEVDDVDHTVQRCDVWETDREELQRFIGEDLRLSAIVRVISEKREAWDAMTKFADEVMGAKEEDERRREAEARDISPSSSRMDPDTSFEK